MEVTWGDPQFGSQQHWDPAWVNHDYLCVADDPFLKNHRIDEMVGRKDIEGHFRASYPACKDASLEDFSLRGIRFRTAEEAKAYIADCLKQGAQYISVQTADDAAYQALITDLFENDEISRMLWDGNTRWTECQYFMNRVFRTLSVEFR